METLYIMYQDASFKQMVINEHPLHFLLHLEDKCTALAVYWCIALISLRS